jgi:gliding motility-associated protein GldL
MASFFETVFFKRVKNFIIGAGASVVLLGALFKILHWEGANEALMIGMFTESFIFLFLGVLPPHKDYYWEKIYPGLDLAPDVHYKKKSGVQGAQGSVTQQLDKMLEDAKVEKELISRLGTNLQKFGENLEKMNEVTDAGAATQEYANQARHAASSLAEMRLAYAEATSAVSELAKVSEDTREYQEQVHAVSKNLGALNAIYEVELQDTSNHLKAMNQFYGNLTNAIEDLNDSVEDTKQYKNQMSQLSQNLTQLNGVYGNMLAAMSFQQGGNQ